MYIILQCQASYVFHFYIIIKTPCSVLQPGPWWFHTHPVQVDLFNGLSIWGSSGLHVYININIFNRAGCLFIWLWQPCTATVLYILTFVWMQKPVKFWRWYVRGGWWWWWYFIQQFRRGILWWTNWKNNIRLYRRQQEGFLSNWTIRVSVPVDFVGFDQMPWRFDWMP